jgi:hypothetical protein
MNREDNMTNREIRDKAIEIVKHFEKKQGRIAQRPLKNKCGYDLMSGKRRIEVKGTTKSNPFQSFIISSKEERDVFENGGYIYRVTDISKDKPKIHIFRKGDIALVCEPRWRMRKPKK